MLDEPLEREIGEPQVGANDDACDQDDRGALDQLLLARPVDLLQLRRRLPDEASEAGAWKLPSLAGRGGRLRRPGYTRGRLTLNRSGLGAVSLPLLLRATGAPLGTRLFRHR